MIKTVRLMGLVILSLMLIAMGTAMAKPSGEGAFLTDSASSVSQVVDQVEGNRLVALRYAKHFRTDPSSVLTFFRSQLTVSSLDEDVMLTVYYLDESRSIVSRDVEFKAGAKVFTNKAGTPILQIGTGNPLGSSLTTAAPVRSQPNPLDAAGPSITTKVLSQPPAELSTVAPVAAGDASSVVEGSESGTLVASNAPGLETIRPSVGASASSWLLPAGLVGAAAVFAGGGGGGSNDQGSIVNPPDPEPVVPEPASMITLGTGLLGFAGVLLRKRR